MKKGEKLEVDTWSSGSSSAIPLHKLLTAGCERGMPHCRQTCSFTSVRVGWDSVLIRILMNPNVTEQESHSSSGCALNSHSDLHPPKPLQRGNKPVCGDRTCQHNGQEKTVHWKEEQDPSKTLGLRLVNVFQLCLTINTNFEGQGSVSLILCIQL